VSFGWNFEKKACLVQRFPCRVIDSIPDARVSLVFRLSID
jgi:hypothetical protein